MNDATLTALALVEALVMEDGEKVCLIRDTTPPDELGAIASALTMILAANLYGQHGEVGALERITDWRMSYVSGAVQ